MKKLLLPLLLILFASSTLAWWDDAWDYRQEITISNNGYADTDYQVFIYLNASNVGPNWDWDEGDTDIAFVADDDTTRLSHGRYTYSVAGQYATYMVKIPVLSNTSDTTIYMYYGNLDAVDNNSWSNTLLYYANDFYASAEYNSWTKSTWCLRDSNQDSMTTINGYSCIATKALPEQVKGLAGRFYINTGPDTIAAFGIGFGDVANNDFFQYYPQYGSTINVSESYMRIQKYVSNSGTDIATTPSPTTTGANEWQYFTYSPTNGNHTFYQTSPDYYTTGTDSTYSTFDYMRIYLKDVVSDPHFKQLWLWKYQDPEPTAVLGTEVLQPVPPVVTINTGNKTISADSDYAISFIVTDEASSSLNCSLIVDNSIEDVNASVLNNTVTGMNMAWDDGYHDYYVACTDGDDLTAMSSSNSILIDTTPPTVASVLPSMWNDTVYENDTMVLIGNATNLALTNVTWQIMYPNGTMFINNETLPGNATSYSWNTEVNISGQPDGTYSMVIYAEDLAANSKTREISFEIDNDPVIASSSSGSASNQQYMYCIDGNCFASEEAALLSVSKTGKASNPIKAFFDWLLGLRWGEWP